MTTPNTTAPAGDDEGLPEPVGFRSRYRSEPGMIGHYPWTYADQRRRKYDRPECEYEDLFTADQMRAAIAAKDAELAEAVEANSMKDIELARLRTENANLKTVMVAAAEEIAAHWNAHCDSEGYGPQNLMRRLEEGIPSEYGYTAGRFAELQAELAALRASAASVQADQRAELDRLLAEHAATIKLATFGAWAAREFRDTLSDVDGGSAQEAMERFGVIEMHQVTEPCGEGCVCAEYDFPCDCYRFPPAISEAMDAALAANKEGA